MAQSRQVVRLANGTEILIEAQNDLIELTLPGSSALRLTREEAWSFAEALDEVSTRAS